MEQALLGPTPGPPPALLAMPEGRCAGAQPERAQAEFEVRNRRLLEEGRTGVRPSREQSADYSEAVIELTRVAITAPAAWIGPSSPQHWT